MQPKIVQPNPRRSTRIKDQLSSELLPNIDVTPDEEMNPCYL